MEKRGRNIGVLALLGAVFALLLVFNLLTPLTADDFLFCFSRAHWSRITGAAEIFPSLAALRREANGRVIPHFFVQLFLLWPKPVFCVVNALMGTLLFYTLYRYVRSGERGRDLLLLVFLLGSVFVLLPAFGQVFLWLTGACNYAWTIVVTFGFLYPFFARYMGREKESPAVLRALALPFAFVAGSWSENGSLAMLGCAFCFLGLDWLREKKLSRRLTLRFLLACAGFLFLMLAPSEQSGRRGEVSESTLTKAAGRVWALLSAHVSVPVLIAALAAALAVLCVLVWLLLRRRVLGCRICEAALLLALLGALALLAWRSGGFAAFVSSTAAAMAAAFGLWLLLMLRGLEKGLDGRTLLAALIFGLAAAGSVLVFLFAAYFPARSACPFICYTSLADALLLSALWEKGSGRTLKAAALVFALLTALLLPMAAKDILFVHRESAARDALLREAAKTPGAVVTVEPITPATKYPATWPGDEDYFDNDIAMYYGLAGYAVSAYVND